MYKILFYLLFLVY
jgi:hypothetical protein